MAGNQRARLRRAIARQRDRVLDWGIAVDDARADVDRNLDRCRESVREQNRAAAHLAYLIKLHNEIEAVADVFGSDIADQHAATMAEGNGGHR